MKSFVTTMVVAALAFALMSSYALAADEAAEPKAASVQEKMAELVKLGPGVQRVNKDKKGRVESLVVVGQSRVSTRLPQFRAEDAGLLVNGVCEGKIVVPQFFPKRVERDENARGLCKPFQQMEGQRIAKEAGLLSVKYREGIGVDVECIVHLLPSKGSDSTNAMNSSRVAS